MTVYVAFNWVACVLTLGLLVVSFSRCRYLAVKPSIVVITAFHLMIQWAATARATQIETYLPNPWAFGVLAQGFPLVGLLTTMFLGRRAARRVWARATDPDHGSSQRRYRAVWFLLICVVLLTLLYLSEVPLGRTGLYAILFDPARAAAAREESLKLVSSALVRYSYSFLVSAFAPLAAVLISLLLVDEAKRWRAWRVVALLGCLGGLLVIVSLTGARAFAASLLQTLGSVVGEVVGPIFA